MYFELYFLLRIWDTRTLLIQDSRIIKSGLEETIRDALKYMYSKINIPESLNHDDYSDYINKFISQEFRIIGG